MATKTMNQATQPVQGGKRPVSTSSLINQRSSEVLLCNHISWKNKQHSMCLRMPNVHSFIGDDSHKQLVTPGSNIG